MPRERALLSPGGYVGLAILASMITLGVMLLIFTEGRPTAEIDLHLPLLQRCDSGPRTGDVCFTLTVDNVGGAAGAAICEVADPTDGTARFANGTGRIQTERIPAESSTGLLIRVRTESGSKDPPDVACEPA